MTYLTFSEPASKTAEFMKPRIGDVKMLLSSVLMLSLTLIFLSCPAYTSGQLDEAKKALIKLIVKDVYGPVKSWLWYYVSTFRSIPYKCPESAVKYLRDPPHNWYIAPKEKDIQELKELFDSINNSDKRVSVVHTFGVPGSGKTELARQFGNSVFCLQNGSSTVLTLNAETPKLFRDSLITSIWEIMNSEDKEFNTETKDEISVLARKLKHLLKSKKRHGWLLIVDNIKDPNITQQDIYKNLPMPGTNEWGTGKMLVTTQVPLTFGYDEYIRVKHNKGLTLEDATNFLCKLIQQKTKRSCDTKVAEEIVEKLERLPLSILAAGDYISRKMNSSGSRSYSCRDYLTEHAKKNILPAHYKLTSNTLYGYSHSMLSALQLTIEESRKVYSNVFSDFIALIGFATMNLGYISSTHVENYLIMRGHEHDHVTVFDFPLVYLSQERFHVHQVVSFAFRKELEQSETYEMLQYILRNISYYFADRYSKFNFDFEILDHFSALVQNLPTRFSNLSDCLIALESKTEHLEAVSAIIFETFRRNNKALNCSKFNTFLIKLSHSPNYFNRVAAHTKFKGYQGLYSCFRELDGVVGSFFAATAAIQLIKEVAPERSELHTVPVSWILLSLSLQLDRSEEILLHTDAFHFLYLPFILRISNYDASQIRNKLCSSLCNVTKSLIPHLEEKVITLCVPDLNNSTVMTEMVALISSVYNEKGPLAVIDKLPLILGYHIPLGRSYRLGKHDTKTENYLGRTNPYGACYEGKNKWEIPDFMSGTILKFYIDYTELVGSKSVEIASRKYFVVFYFVKVVKKMEGKSKDYDTVCRSIKDQLKAFFEQRPTFSAATELKIQNAIGSIMETFYKNLLLFVHNYCDILLNDLKRTEFSKMLRTWFTNWLDEDRTPYQSTEGLLVKLLRVTGLQREETKEITDVLLEIVAGIIHAPNNDKFQFAFDLIPSDRPQKKYAEFEQEIYRYGKVNS